MRGVFRGRRGWRRLAGTAVLVALVASAGCSDEPDADSAGDTVSRPGETSAAEERSEAAEAAEEERESEDPPGQAEAEKLAPPDEPEPVIDLTGPVEDIERIYREQRAYRSWLFSHPDPRNTERLARITHRDCPCWQVDHELLSRYAEQGRWWVGPDSEILNIEVVDRPTNHVVTLHVTWRRDLESRLVDETGQVHDQLPRARSKQEVQVRRGKFDPAQTSSDRLGQSWKLIGIRDLQYEELSKVGGQ